ncbi:hypothetical protein LAZ67_13001171 [Cordylochernes scorpioides]|uniref:CCHC-type domain-containing protein n=1 Tax=Cordylochernes scorpioides TaxID=51811 RepID=A0ABY6L635_9ARAC|nr:hypothetical protein LAZ67_13001171 [Cordylochernes scorpioides]
MPGHRKRRQFKQTDAFTRGMVIGLKRAGWSMRQIAADTHLGASTVHRLNVGATRVTSARVDRCILRQAVAAPQATCTAILQHVQDTLDHSISTRTISRRLVANGLHSCRPLRRLPLTPPNRRQRLEWCRARSTWMTEWHRVVFSDESRFCLSSDSRRVRVWRRRGERSNPAAIVERPTVRQRGIMVWGAIAYDSRSPLLRIQGTMTAQRYVDDVLRPMTLPYLQGVPNALYQQDNARPHTARISQQALQDVQMLPWPPYSPDLSPIEHVWDIIGRRLHALPQPRSEDELWQMVEREWRAIPQDAIRTLIDSLPRRVAACIAVRDIQRPDSTLQLVEKLDRYSFRKKKRKIDSVEQEETTMDIKKEAKTQLGSFFVQHLPRNPSMFSGEGGEYPHNWFKEYESVAKNNQWDETLCLANVCSYLNGTALKWFENNEERIQTWTEFMSQLESVFGKNENLRLRTEKILKPRAQLKGESTKFYIQDVMRLCKEVDPHMNEEDKIFHLIKGIAEELYQTLLPRDAHNTEQFVTECRRIEAVHCKRVTSTRYERLPNVASFGDHDDRADLSSIIRQIVRKEVQRALGSPRKEPKIATTEEMVKEEIGGTLAPISKSRSPPQKERPRQFYNTRYEAQTMRPHSEPHYRKQGGRRDSNKCRTTEGKPICFHCGRPGHVVRYCRDRRREYEERQNWNYKQRDRQETRTFYNSRSSQEPSDDLPRENIRRYRSPSTYTGRKGQHSSSDRRSSQSPRRSRQES